MKKKEILKFLPNLKSLKKEAVAKSRQGEKLAKEGAEATRIVQELNGVVLHDGFPIKVIRYSGGVEIQSGCEEVKRTAYVKANGAPNKFIVTTYKNDGSEIDGTPVDGEYGKAVALRIAKEFVANGKKTSNKPKAATRGRRRKS